ncbi:MULTISPECIES: hypothetical protein [Hyphomicrobiales]|uniref:hypothetical protein n=1 Tax=Hyphomicrobiales TaxID=356 RepID=UPI0003A796D7|nr:MULTISPECIES: hypothetical protein [Phyllobacteriaceae]MCX8572870.1 hypothetical protein [Aminobacter sp. MET-1]
MVKRMIGWIVWLLMLIAFVSGMAACTRATGSFCDIAKPIRLADVAQDALSDQEVADVLAHNRKGAALCGWRP